MIRRRRRSGSLGRVVGGRGVRDLLKRPEFKVLRVELCLVNGHPVRFPVVNGGNKNKCLKGVDTDLQRLGRSANKGDWDVGVMFANENYQSFVRKVGSLQGCVFKLTSNNKGAVG